MIILKYDVCIIGGGPAAIFAAYEFKLKYPSINVVLIEEGHEIKKRSCPISTGKVKQCISCKPCDIMRGFGGAGAFSDGKLTLTPDVGGNLVDYMERKEVEELYLE